MVFLYLETTVMIFVLKSILAKKLLGFGSPKFVLLAELLVL